MINEEERMLSVIHEGRTAQAILAWLTPLLDDLEKEIHLRIKSLHRQGKDEVLASVAAELCVLEDLRSRIGSKIRSGKTASHERSNKE